MISAIQLKGYFWYFFGIMGVVFFWTGVWDGIGNLWPLQNPLVSFIVGVIMLTLSGFIFKDLGVFGAGERTIESVLREVHHHPQKQEFHIEYLDKVKNKHIHLEAGKLKNIEKEFLVFLDKAGKEIFIPYHRVTEVLHKGKTHWKA
jgi:uncharacterized protein (UPF0248 family)